MSASDWAEVLLRKPITVEIPAYQDSASLHLLCTGGLSAGQHQPGTWIVGPLLRGDRPIALGPFATVDLNGFLRSHGLRPIALNHVVCMDGDLSSSYKPVLPGQRGSEMSAADLWGNIARNFSRHRMSDLERFRDAADEDLDRYLDDSGEPEKLANAISFSLRNLDFDIEAIYRVYHERLTLRLRSHSDLGSASASASERDLYARVLSFYGHFGAARDYLASLIAYRLGFDPNSRKTDSLSRLLSAMKLKIDGKDHLLDQLVDEGWIVQGSKEWKPAGWLEAASSLRNRIIHTTPYGQRSAERYGRIEMLNQEAGLYRYTRGVLSSSGQKRDLLDVTTEHYHFLNQWMHMAAKACGYNAAMLNLTDKDIISMDVRKFPK